MRSPALLTLIGGAALLLGACSGDLLPNGLFGDDGELEVHFDELAKVEEGYVAGVPKDKEYIPAAKKKKVTMVISNLPAEESAEKLTFDELAACEAAGIEFVRIPITPATFSAEDVDAFAEALERADGKVLVHCSSGNRSGGLYAAYLARHEGVPVEEAIERGKAAGLNSDRMIELVREIAAQPRTPEATGAAPPAETSETGETGDAAGTSDSSDTNEPR